jgi:hypothetical protein
VLAEQARDQAGRGKALSGVCAQQPAGQALCQGHQLDARAAVDALAILEDAVAQVAGRQVDLVMRRAEGAVTRSPGWAAGWAPACASHPGTARMRTRMLAKSISTAVATLSFGRRCRRRSSASSSTKRLVRTQAMVMTAMPAAVRGHGGAGGGGLGMGSTMRVSASSRGATACSSWFRTCAKEA